MDRLSRLFAKEKPAPRSLADLEAFWQARCAYWARRLGGIRLGVEPIEDQLARYRRVTWMLTAVPAFVATVLFTLFTVFRRPDIGAVVAAILFLPLVAGAWFGYFLLQRRAGRDLLELDAYESARGRLELEAAD